MDQPTTTITFTRKEMNWLSWCLGHGTAAAARDNQLTPFAYALVDLQNKIATAPEDK